MTIQETLIERVKAAQEQGWSREDIAWNAGVSLSWLNHFMTDTKKTYNLRQADQLAVVLDDIGV